MTKYIHRFIFFAYVPSNLLRNSHPFYLTSVLSIYLFNTEVHALEVIPPRKRKVLTSLISKAVIILKFYFVHKYSYFKANHLDLIKYLHPFSSIWHLSTLNHKYTNSNIKEKGNGLESNIYIPCFQLHCKLDLMLLT